MPGTASLSQMDLTALQGERGELLAALKKDTSRARELVGRIARLDAYIAAQLERTIQTDDTGARRKAAH
ncbi:hypothetical protein [Tropicibacter naphthalenivorans]|uniref:Uncharacterized protein n=1 Tax=Tropicibacter naphthalenivorans TaxID=441103 RepID=A0A0N7LYF4_9RHOB|nr:hypothetical protein [Tropicibacter naphthalenivorans]CUH74713.1 hypothetical protein TRN7648_00045 [Tropicibacter naphthalenivorans]SMC49620.1 hypothetical protein SAMN04488093_101835 [Tropicibacter naphthalenivorans]